MLTFMMHTFCLVFLYITKTSKQTAGLNPGKKGVELVLIQHHINSSFLFVFLSRIKSELMIEPGSRIHVRIPHSKLPLLQNLQPALQIMYMHFMACIIHAEHLTAEHGKEGR